MPNRAILTRAIDAALAPDAWRREKLYWYLDTDDLILLIDLGKEDSPGKFSIGLGIFIKPDARDESVKSDAAYLSWQSYLGQYYDYQREYPAGKSPKHHHCHVRTNLATLDPNSSELALALDLENKSISDDDRSLIISSALAGHAAAMFRQLKSLDDLRGIYARRLIEHPRWIIPMDIRHFLARNSN